ncbi:MAG TPA: hypothetical protein VHL57_04155 [Flavobacteriales bacterium]|nr:hypothetical protein [Flavobacteriales bacterium]
MVRLSSLPRIVLVFAVALCSLGLAAQCKYEVDEVDPINGQHTFRTKATRIHDGVKVKDGISVGFLDMKLAKGPQGGTLELHIHPKNPQGRMLMLRVPNDSLTVKFSDGSVLTVPNTVLPSQYTNSFNGKPMVSFTYPLTAELIAKFRAGVTVQVLRITTMDQKWDFVEFTTDPATLFRTCWAEQ